VGCLLHPRCAALAWMSARREDPITRILLHLRRRVVEGDAMAPPATPAAIRTGAKLGRLAFGTPWLYRFGAWLLPGLTAPFRKDGWFASLPAPADRWTRVRPFPAFAARFRQWWSRRK